MNSPEKYLFYSPITPSRHIHERHPHKKRTDEGPSTLSGVSSQDYLTCQVRTSGHAPHAVVAAVISTLAALLNTG